MGIYLGPTPDLKGENKMQLGPIKEMFKDPPKEVQEKLEAEPPTIFKILDSLDLLTEQTRIEPQMLLHNESANISLLKTDLPNQCSDEEGSQSNTKYLELVSHLMQSFQRPDKNRPAPEFITVKE